MPYEDFVEPLCNIAREAGRIIMGYYEGELDVQLKQDASPVTAADLAANAYIVRQLSALAPSIPIVSEEDSASHEAGVFNAQGADLRQGAFWLVDPLDGTKSFIKRTGEFTVNIALIERQQPVLGVIYIPVQERLYFTGADGRAWLKRGTDAAAEPVAVRRTPAAGLTVVASASHNSPATEDFIASLPKVAQRVGASSSLKLCRVAEGAADVYPRFGTTMEWDIAAGHAILNAAGGSIACEDGSAFLYAKEAFRNPNFIAWGKR